MLQVSETAIDRKVPWTYHWCQVNEGRTDSRFCLPDSTHLASTIHKNECQGRKGEDRPLQRDEAKGASMKILGISCSPRAGGNTEILMEVALRRAEEQGAETTLVTLAGKIVAPCDACNACHRTDKCHVDDYMQDLYPMLLEADGIIFGTPVYFWSVSAQAKALIDRTFGLPVRGGLKNKVAAVVATAERSGGVSAIEVFTNFFAVHEMLMAGWAIGLTGAEGFTDKQAVRRDEKGLARAASLGARLVSCMRERQAL